MLQLVVSLRLLHLFFSACRSANELIKENLLLYLYLPAEAVSALLSVEQEQWSTCS